jgi:yeast amino acid transporter
MALEGKAPSIFTRTTRTGVPIYCVIFVLLLSLLSFLQLGENSAIVLSWFVNLVTASQLINFSVMTFTFIRFYKACKRQGLDRNQLPYKGLFQPYAAWYGFVGTTTMSIVGGYTVFLKGAWSVPTFLFSYMMIFLFPVVAVGWKLWKRTKWIKIQDIDLYANLEEIEDYERHYVPTPDRNRVDKYFNKLFS